MTLPNNETPPIYGVLLDGPTGFYRVIHLEHKTQALANLVTTRIMADNIAELANAAYYLGQGIPYTSSGVAFWIKPLTAAKEDGNETWQPGNNGRTEVLPNEEDAHDETQSD